MAPQQPKKPRFTIIIKRAKPGGFKTILKLIFVAIILTAFIRGAIGRFICAEHNCQICLDGNCKRSFFGSFGTKNEGLNPMRRPLHYTPHRPIIHARAKPTEPPIMLLDEEESESVEATPSSGTFENIRHGFGQVYNDENIWERAYEPQPQPAYENYEQPELELPGQSVVIGAIKTSISVEQHSEELDDFIFSNSPEQPPFIYANLVLKDLMKLKKCIHPNNPQAEYQPGDCH